MRPIQILPRHGDLEEATINLTVGNICALEIPSGAVHSFEPFRGRLREFSPETGQYSGRESDDLGGAVKSA